MIIHLFNAFLPGTISPSLANIEPIELFANSTGSFDARPNYAMSKEVSKHMLDGHQKSRPRIISLLT